MRKIVKVVSFEENFGGALRLPSLPFIFSRRVLCNWREGKTNGRGFVDYVVGEVRR